MRSKMIFAVLLLGCAVSLCASAQPPAHAKKEALPPGLQKNAERGKPLPPGWQKKLAVGDVLDEDIYARGKVVVPVGEDGSISIEVEGTRLRLNARTRTILGIHLP
jgi:hypothetical protein